MQWIAPSEKDSANSTLEKRLWEAADQLRANSGLTAAQYSAPVLGSIFLRFAEARFAKRREELAKAGSSGRRGTSRVDEPSAYHAEGVVYLTPNARFDHLLALPEGGNIGQAINEAMADIEKHNPQLAGVLPRTFQVFTSTLLKELLKKVSEIPDTLEYDAFGRIYEYFLGEFARTEGQKGGEFFTPSCIVRLIVEILEPYHGRVFDPACGSGGMFVQSARFVQEHRKNPSAELSLHGQERVGATVALSRMNLASGGGLRARVLGRHRPGGPLPKGRRRPLRGGRHGAHLRGRLQGVPEVEGRAGCRRDLAHGRHAPRHEGDASSARSTPSSRTCPSWPRSARSARTSASSAPSGGS